MKRNENRILKKILAIFIIEGFFLFGSWINPNDSQNRNAFAQPLHPCLNRVNIPMSEMHWLYVPESANELYTEEQYYFLAGQLIANKVVDASICPMGGLKDDRYANACGMATALPTVIVVQNLTNEAILQAWKEVGVPPVLLKQQIRRESQFWPSIYTTSKDDFNYHYGLGHVTYIGMENALQWNHDLYAKLCSPLYNGNCASEEGLVNQFLSSMVATCSTCENGIDPVALNRSVDILAEVVMGFCYQTSQLIYNATGWYPGMVVDYPTIWKLTLINYTSGPNCVFDAVDSTFKVTEGPMTWSEISAHISKKSCVYGLEYANLITARYFDFPPKK